MCLEQFLLFYTSSIYVLNMSLAYARMLDVFFTLALVRCCLCNSEVSVILAAIRVASLWYQHHLGAAKVLLLTNDMDNRRKAREDGIVCETGILISTFLSILCWCLRFVFSFCSEV